MGDIGWFAKYPGGFDREPMAFRLQVGKHEAMVAYHGHSWDWEVTYQLRPFEPIERGQVIAATPETGQSEARELAEAALRRLAGSGVEGDRPDASGVVPARMDGRDRLGPLRADA